METEDDTELVAVLSLVDGALSPLWVGDELDVDVGEFFLPEVSNWPPSVDFSGSQASTNVSSSDDGNPEPIIADSGTTTAVRDAHEDQDGKAGVGMELGVREDAKTRKTEELVLPEVKTERKRKQKRPTNYKPNKARDEQRKELKELRARSMELEQHLSMLKKLRPFPNAREGDKLTTWNRRVVTAPVAASVWKSIAKRQFDKLTATVHENKELKAQVGAGQSMIQRVEKLLRSHNLEKAAQSACIEQSHHLMQLPRFQLDPSMVKRLEAGVANCYHEVPLVFKSVHGNSSRTSSFSGPELHADASGNLFTRVFGSKIFPYDIRKTGQAAWTQFSFSVRPNARCFVDEVVHATNDLVIGRFATELHMDGTKMVVFGWQAKRRYIEAGREVVVWQSQMDPIEFRGQKVAGAAYEEHGFFVMHHGPELPSGYTKLQSCYRVAPSSPVQSIPENALALNVTEFVLHWMASMIPVNHQIIEDSLFESSLSSSPQCVA